MTPIAPPRAAAFREFVNRRWDLVLSALLLVYFLVRLVFLAIWLDPTVPPDEITHFGRIGVYSKALWLPEDSPETYPFGLISHSPFLYYFLMGKILLFNVFPISDLLFLRLINAMMAVSTTVYSYRWFGLMTGNALARTLFLLVITNTLMFTGIGASVSYDNLTNLFGAMSIYYLFTFFDQRRPSTLVACAACWLAGCLTKVTFLPLALILLAIFSVHERRSLGDLPRRLLADLKLLRIGRVLLYGLTLVLFALTLKLYGGNYLRFGWLTPSSTQVLGVENAMKYRIYARNYVVRQYREGKLTWEEALEMAAKIPQTGNRRRALQLLHVEKHPGLKGTIWEPHVYLGIWSHITLQRTVGYDGHRVMSKDFRELAPLWGMFLVAFLVFVRKWHPAEAKGYPTYAAVIILFYVSVLMWHINYPRYLTSGVPDLDVRGRYLFPFMAPICGLFVRYLIEYLPRRSQVLVALAVALYFIYGDFPFFLLHLSPCWFKGTAAWPECAATLG